MGKQVAVVLLGLLLVTGCKDVKKQPEPDPSWYNPDNDTTCWWVSPSPGEVTWKASCNKEVENECWFCSKESDVTEN